MRLGCESVCHKGKDAKSRGRDTVSSSIQGAPIMQFSTIQSRFFLISKAQIQAFMLPSFAHDDLESTFVCRGKRAKIGGDALTWKLSKAASLFYTMNGYSTLRYYWGVAQVVASKRGR